MKIPHRFRSAFSVPFMFACAASAILAISLFFWLGKNSKAAAARQNPVQSTDGIWQAVEDDSLTSLMAHDIPRTARSLQLNPTMLETMLASAPLAHGKANENNQTIMSLPLADGSFARVRIEASSVMDAALTKRYPEIRSYRAIGVDDPNLTARFDWTPLGFHALILTGETSVTVLPINQQDKLHYAAFDSGSAAELADSFTCEVIDPHANEPGFGEASTAAIEASVGTQLRTYRLALTASWEYSNAFGQGTVAGTVASFNAWLNSVNAIYERELSVRMQLVDDADVIFSTEQGYNSSNDPYTNGSTVTMLGQARPVLRDRVGAANYDIGHTLGTGGGGVAYLGVVCSDAQISNDGRGPAKGGAVSLVSGSLGNHAGINVISHEMGHQFGAYHSYNSGVGSCGSNRSSNSAVEPGSGITIMSYAGLCGTENLAARSELYFHAISFAQITAYLASGATCASVTNTNNNAPTVDGGADYTIPKLTPFALTARASDANATDASALTYAWDQTDVANAFANPPYDDAADGANSTRPLFRSYSPTASPTRTFPQLSYILNNANKPDLNVNGYRSAEFLPSVARALNFRVVVRDGRGGVTDDQVRLTVNGTAGPFLVTAPNSATTWAGGSTQTVSWSVNNTNVAPVNCANVRILLSTDGGASFPHILAASTPNDGGESILVPSNLATSVARIKVEALGNIFFDISDAGFAISAGSGGNETACPTVSSVSPTNSTVGSNVTIIGANLSGVTSVKFANNVTAQFTVNSATQITATIPATAVSGVITLSKANCADVQTSAITIGTACALITINPANLPSGVLNVTYSQTLTQTGATAPFNWGLTTGALPNGLSLSPSGELSGAPTQAGTFNFSVRVTGGNGCAETKAFSLVIANCPASGCNDGAQGTLTLNPNPIQVCDGSSLGVTALTWFSTGTTAIQLRLGSPTGEILYQGNVTNGTGTTGKWVTNGMQFFLTNAATGATLASTTAALTTQGCSGGTTGGGTSTSSTTTFRISPNPLLVCDGTGLGIASLNWSTTAATSVQVRRDSANGQIVGLGRASGIVRTGKYVRDGMLFYLVNSANGSVLASVRASVTAAGCALAANPAEHPFTLTASRTISSRRATARASVQRSR